jgi:plasmid maintenance system antidote protein VapI
MEKMPLATAGDIRAAIARYRLRIYHVASLVGLHPSRLSHVLNERAPLTPELAARLTKVIEEEACPE